VYSVRGRGFCGFSATVAVLTLRGYRASATEGWHDGVCLFVKESNGRKFYDLGFVGRNDVVGFYRQWLLGLFVEGKS
jgi:hypothetical protein